MICTHFSRGTKHDFKLFKDSKLRVQANTTILTDTGYQGIAKIHSNSVHPKKGSKKKPLSSKDKQFNRKISSERAVNENVIGSLKRFKILCGKYRNRRKRFGLRFNLIAGIHNYELG